MRVVVTGATGNVGIPLLRRLCADPAIAGVVGVARRPPAEGTGPAGTESVEWLACELGAADAPERLRPALVGADVVVHLAWLLQPSHRPQVMYATNVDGTRQVIDAVVAAGVPALVHASSVGAYSPGPKDRYVDEFWPTEGIASSVYSRCRPPCCGHAGHPYADSSGRPTVATFRVADVEHRGHRFGSWCDLQWYSARFL